MVRTTLAHEPVTWRSALVGLVLVVVGLTAVAVVVPRTVGSLVESHELRSDGAQTTGTVVRSGCGRGDRDVWIAFDVDGERHSFTQRGGCLSPGEAVTVFYDVRDPDRAVSPDAARHPAVRILALVAVVFLGLVLAASGLVRLPLRRGAPPTPAPLREAGPSSPPHGA